VPGYWGGTIDPGRVVFRPVPDTAARIAALLRGEVDLITTLPPDHVQRVAAGPGTKVERVLYAGLHLLVVDSRRPPLDNPRVKQALSLAIDREAIVRSLWHGQGIVPNGPIPRGDSHYDATLPPLAHDPALARRVLREGGYAGEPIVLEMAPGYLTNDRTMSEAVVAMWRDVGLNVQLEQLEYAALMQRVRERKLKGLRWGSPASPLGDPDGMMWRLLGPGGIHDTWRHSRFDELGQAAQFSVDEAFRGRAYREMTRIFLEHLPWIPVIQPIEAYGLRRHVDWKPYPNQQLEIRRFNLQLRPA
jgi:peptide/nickel transport system substrate-binding protein